MVQNKKYIQNVWELDVYQRLARLRKVVLTKIIPKLPKEERFDLCDQARRACKGACAILAEGFAKRFQIKHWQKYLNDCLGECYEMIDHLSVIKDVYSSQLNPESIQIMIDQYKICIKQLTKLGSSWKTYHRNSEIP